MNYQHILDQLPYAPPFLFVDALQQIDANGASGSYTFLKELDFYQGHFKDVPVTPGVLLTECCAQIGLVCLGIFLTEGKTMKDARTVAMSSAEMEFYLPVYPGEKVEVRSEKIYYRFNKLKCSVKMYNQNQELVCKGVLAGMLNINRDE